MAAAVFVCDFGAEDQFLGVIVQSFYCVLDFTVVDLLAVNEFPDLCGDLDGLFESRFCFLCELNKFVVYVRGIWGRNLKL